MNPVLLCKTVNGVLTVSFDLDFSPSSEIAGFARYVFLRETPILRGEKARPMRPAHSLLFL